MTICRDKELEKLYHCVYQAIKRKTRSEKEYRYVRPNFSDNFQDRALFEKCSIPEKMKLNDYKFTKKDFLRIFQAFKAENKKHYSAFQKLSDEFNNNLISFEDFSEDRDYYLNWLSDFKALISAFEY